MLIEAALVCRYGPVASLPRPILGQGTWSIVARANGELVARSSQLYSTRRVRLVGCLALFPLQLDDCVWNVYIV